MPRSAWLAAGALLAALAWPMLGPAAVAVLGGGTLAATGLAGLTRLKGRGGSSPRPVRLAAIGALAVGELALAARLVVGGALSPAPAVGSLPAGHGPWHAVVLATGSPGDGVQRVTVRLDGPLGLGVAATVPRYPPLAPGDRVTFEGTLRQPPTDGYGTYLARIGVAATVLSSELTLDPAEGGVGSALEAIRGGADAALARVLPEPEAGLAAGILVGLRGRVDRALAADCTAAGVSHVVAISGWNIAIVAAVVAALLGRLGRRPRALATLWAIVAYTVIVGASASVLRAALMAGVVLIARESGRGSGAAVALGWAAALMLLADPTVASDAGFQLSTAATAGLIAWSRSLTVRLSVLGGRLPSGSIPRWLTETLGSRWPPKQPPCRSSCSTSGGSRWCPRWPTSWSCRSSRPSWPAGPSPLRRAASRSWRRCRPRSWLSSPSRAGCCWPSSAPWSGQPPPYPSRA